MTLLALRFFNEAPPESMEVCGEAFLFDGAVIRARPGGEIAKHVNDQWVVGGEVFLKAECRAAVECVFDPDQKSQERLGPFDHVALIDGVLTADQRPLAMLREMRGWLSLVGDEVWKEFSIVPAAR